MLGGGFIVQSCIEDANPSLETGSFGLFAPGCKSLHTLQKLSSLTARQIRYQLIRRASPPTEFHCIADCQRRRRAPWAPL